MFAIHVILARTSIKQAATLVPALVPGTWTGGAAEACQRDLDDALASFVALDDLLDQADSAVDAVPDVGSLACGRVS
mgnify:CR=1 FL=1